MRAVVLTRYGAADVLRITEVATPAPRANEVCVKVRVVGINFAEVLSRRGLYGWAPKLPYILGMEAFGEIDAVGESVATHKPGDRVIVGTQFGTYAEFICVPAERALPAPPDFTPEQCAAFAVSYLTAWIGLMEMARLRTSDTLLVTSAAGGVGTAAVQIGSRFGARVIGAAGKGKQDAVRALGADLALDYSDVRWEAQLGDVNVVLEMSGSEIYRAAVRHLAPMGRIVIAGASNAFPRTRNPFARLASLRNLPRASIFDMLRRSYGVMSFHVGWLLDAGVVQSQWRELVHFAGEHRITPVIAEAFAFDDIASAHRALEERRNIGKVIVHVTNDL
ncbi:MAG TPA: zinc-binding dehydrogenase [Thermoanaerobaculia bacterium]|nr:zinc-binding dehydrogenase [Thermoanaerobaculia bacterium]